MNKTSQEIKDEETTTYYGINPDSLRVERVGLTRGGTLTYWQIGREPSVYRIRGGRPAREEVGRVFHLTDIVGIANDAGAPADDGAQLAALEGVASGLRHGRGDFHDYSAEATDPGSHADRAHHADHRALSEYEHTGARRGAEIGTHPLAGPAVAAAGRLRDLDAPGTGDTDP